MKWSLVDAVGYGGLGFGLGVLATWDDRLESGPGPVAPRDAALVLIGLTALSGSSIGPAEAALALLGATTLSFVGFPTDLSGGPSGITLAVVGATTVAGTLAGGVIGRRAQNVVANGGRIDGLHRTAVIGGAVMAGGTLGALASVPLIVGEGEGTPLGSDEQTLALLVVSGSALGALFAFRNRHEFGPRDITVSPGIGSTRAGLNVRLRF